MAIPTEPIGTLPRPAALVGALATMDADDPRLEPLYEDAIRDTVERFEATGSPVVSDGGQRRHGSLWKEVLGGRGGRGLDPVAPDGLPVPLADGSQRRLPRLVAGPFRSGSHAGRDLAIARRHAHVPVKSVVRSPSALSLLYPADELDGYPREAFLQDLLDAHEAEVRECLAHGADSVQIDCSDVRVAPVLDPTGALLDGFFHLLALGLARFSDGERRRIGVSLGALEGLRVDAAAEADEDALLTRLLALPAGCFYLPLAGVRDPLHRLDVVREHLPAGRRVFVGVVDPTEATVESAERVFERTLQAAAHLPIDQLGTTDDGDYRAFEHLDAAANRELAFARVRARVEGTALAAAELARR